MKKLFALLLCLVMSVMLLASCGGESKSPEALCETAFENTADLDAYELDMSISMTVSMDMMGTSVTQSMPMNIKLSAKDLKSETPKISMDISMEMEGEEFSATAYIEGDWMYMTSDGESYKVPTSAMDELGGMTDYSKQFEDLLVDLPEVIYEGVSATKNGDGSKTVALSLSAEQFEAIYAELATSLGESMSMGMLGEGTDITFKPATLSVTVKDDLVSKYDMDFSFDIAMDMDGDSTTTEDAVSMTMSVSYDIDVKKTSGVTVTPPEGYESFEEIPMY